MTVKSIELNQNNVQNNEFDYPCILKDKDGDVWLAFDEYCGSCLIDNSGAYQVGEMTEGLTDYAPFTLYEGKITLENE